MIVEKALKLAGKMDVPVLGLVENYSYLSCPHCNEKINVFGESHAAETAEKYGIPLIARLPIIQEISVMSDSGTMETVEDPVIDELGRQIREWQTINK